MSESMFDEMESEVSKLQKEPALEIEQKGIDFGKWVLVSPKIPFFTLLTFKTLVCEKVWRVFKFVIEELL